MRRRHRSILVILLLMSSQLASCSDAPLVQTVQAGEDVTLLCHGPSNASAVTWRKNHHQNHVYQKRDGHNVPHRQDPSYAPRVELVDGEMKDGNLSLFMRKVTSNDSGVYSCSYGFVGSVVAVINLTVTDPAAKDGAAMDGDGKGGAAMGGDGKGGAAMDGDGKGGAAMDGDGKGGAAMDGDGKGGAAMGGATKDGAAKNGAGKGGAGKGGAAMDGDGKGGAAMDGDGKGGAAKNGAGKGGAGKGGAAMDGDGKGGAAMDGAAKNGAGKGGAGIQPWQAVLIAMAMKFCWQQRNFIL